MDSSKLLSDAVFTATNKTTFITISQTHKPITLLLFILMTNMSFYYEIIFFPFGLIFNMLLLLVFGMSSVGTTKTARVYYLAMAYGELGTVLFKDMWYFWADLGVPHITGGLNPLGAVNGMGNIGNLGNGWICGLHVFLWYSHEMFANYSFVLFELERVIAIYAPIHARSLLTKRGSLLMVFYSYHC